MSRITRMILSMVVLAAVSLPARGATAATAAADASDAPTVHSVCDISQSFTFYMDGRFHRQYLADFGRDARNWGTLSELDLENVNLLVLTGGDVRLPYEPAAITRIAAYVRAGGTLLLMADGGDPMPPGRAVAAAFGADLAVEPAAAPLRGAGELIGQPIVFRGGRTLVPGPDWTVLVMDAARRPVLAARRFGRGHVVLGSRGLFGQRPDASDPINAEWITPMLRGRAATKPIDPARPHRSTSAELQRQVGPLTLEFHRGTEQFATAVHAVYEEVRPHLVAITGVEPSLA